MSGPSPRPCDPLEGNQRDLHESAQNQEGQQDGQGASKRQRKLPQWLREEYHTDDAIKDVGKGGFRIEAPQEDLPPPVPAGRGRRGDPEKMALGKITHYRLLGLTKLELEMEYNGQRYRGVVERAAISPNVGIVMPLDFDRAATDNGSTNNSNLCGLCNLPLAQSVNSGNESADDASRVARVLVSSNWSTLVHLQCGLWAPEVAEDENHNLVNLAGALRRGRALRCRQCRQRGATIGCFHRGCQHVYHLPCAVAADCYLDGRTFSLWCPMHRD